MTVPYLSELKDDSLRKLGFKGLPFSVRGGWTSIADRAFYGHLNSELTFAMTSRDSFSVVR